MGKEHNGAGIWFDPQNFVPQHQEIVAMDCLINNADGGMVRIIQTGMYEVREDRQEVWHSPQPFKVINRWMRYPALIEIELLRVQPKVIL